MAEVLLNPYCSLQDLRDELRNEDTDAVVVDQLTRAINDASRFVESRLGRDFLPHDHTTTPLVVNRFSSAIFEDVLFLPLRVISIAEVKADDLVLVEGTDYELLKNSRGTVYGIGCLGGNWNVARFEIKGQFGYAQTTTADVPTGIPSEIRRAAVLIAAAWSGHNTHEVIGMDGSKTEVASKDIPKAVWQLLGTGTPILT